MYNPTQTELSVLEFWKKKEVYDKIRRRNKGKKPFYFLQGPPYTSARIHIGQAWNNSMKDILLRFKRMRGFDVWDRAGYDMHGLPTARIVQKKLNLLDKDAIESFGVDKFIKHCIETSSRFAKSMNEDLLRLGIWMDYDHAYWPINPEFIEGEWWLIKKAHEAKRLYKGKKIMHWCASCETALAKHELEYKNIKEKSIFVKLKLKNKKSKTGKKEHLIIWTTTPWTLPFNLAVMVNPKFEYVKVKINSEIWIIAKDLVAEVMKNLGQYKYKIIETIKGKCLEGIEYEAPFYSELKEIYDKLKKKHKAIHTIVLSEQYVTTESGSGLVHSAPGCGPEDFEVGQEYNIPAFNILDEKGIFTDMANFTGMKAKKDDSKFSEILEKKGILLAETEIEHEYPFCWRCHEPIIFRATEQWFLKIEDLILAMLKANEKVKWVPSWGKNAFDSWVKSLKDNSITRQRFWGTPAPIWECPKCKNVIVIGSKNELKKIATTKIPKDLHRPWIDAVKVRCKCGQEIERIPDILDVWLDAGTVSWNCLYYPKRTDIFKKLFPADFILEATEQIKLWFSMLLICSMVALKKPCYKTVYMHGMILDWQGMKMSKSLGNIISPYEVIDKHGADILRYYICETKAGENINFSWEGVKQKQRHLNILWNIKDYVLELASLLKKNPEKLKPKLDIEEKYMLSRCHTTIQAVTTLLENYHLDNTVTKIEELFLELSRVYIQLIREKVSLGSMKEREAVLYTCYKILLADIKLFTLICPFITESIYQDLKKTFKLKPESIHLCEWPKADKKLQNKKLEQNFSIVLEAIEKGLALRAKAGLGIRWPLASATIKTKTKLDKELQNIIARQLNVKKIMIKKSKEKTIEVILDTKLAAELEAEGYSREIARAIQEARKKAGLKKEQKIDLAIECSKQLQKALEEHKKFAMERVNASKLVAEEKIKKKYTHEYDKSIKRQKIKIAFNVL